MSDYLTSVTQYFGFQWTPSQVAQLWQLTYANNQQPILTPEDPDLVREVILGATRIRNETLLPQLKEAFKQRGWTSSRVDISTIILTNTHLGLLSEQLHAAYRAQSRRLPDDLDQQLASILQQQQASMDDAAFKFLLGLGAYESRDQLYWSLPQRKSDQRNLQFEVYQYRRLDTVAEGILKCVCGSSRVSCVEKQTRSSDEPMTLIATCRVCGNHWREG